MLFKVVQISHLFTAQVLINKTRLPKYVLPNLYQELFNLNIILLILTWKSPFLAHILFTTQQGQRQLIFKENQSFLIIIRYLTNIFNDTLNEFLLIFIECLRMLSPLHLPKHSSPLDFLVKHLRRFDV